MKLLFLIDGVLDPTGATHVLSRRVCEALAGQGHEVTVLQGSAGGEEEQRVRQPVGVRVLTFHESSEKKLVGSVLRWRAEGRSLMSAAFGVLADPALRRVAVPWLLVGRRPLEQAYIAELEVLCKQERFDWVIAVAAPHYASFALGKARIPCPKALYWFDPFSTRETLDKLHRGRERKLYEEVRLVFLTQLMYEENRHNAFQKYLPKMHPLPFPNLVPPENALFAAPKKKTDRVECVFAGSFQAGVREPDGLLDFFEALPGDIHLTLVGDLAGLSRRGGVGEIQAALGDRITLTGKLPYDEAMEKLAVADVLVNLGNRNTNQLPSKIYDYISTGKPILNLWAAKGCPVKDVLESYPMAASVPQGVPKGETTRYVAEFLHKNAGKHLSFEQVAALYPQHQPAAVARQMEQILLVGK